MANVIKLKRSSTPGAVPSTTSIVVGELAINTADGVVYLKKEDGSVVSPGVADGSVTEAKLSSDLRNALIHPFLLGGM